jgi:SMI1/KNR4 family protein SUKH-1
MLHDDLKVSFPEFAAQLAARASEPYLIEHVLPAATESAISSLETDLGLPLPDSYKRLLRITRGFWLLGGAIQLSAEHPFFHDFPPIETLTPQQRRGVTEKGGTWPPASQGMLCFAEYFLEADGDQVLWDVSKGLQGGEYPVVYYAHEGCPPGVRPLATGFGEWLRRCLDAFRPASDEE